MSKLTKIYLIVTICVVTFSYLSFRYEKAIWKFFSLLKFKPFTFSEPAIKRELNYRLFTPDLSQGKLYPLVLILHGGGNRGIDNKKHIKSSLATSWIRPKFQKKYPCFVLAPQCPYGVEWITIRPKSVPYGHYEQNKYPEGDEMKLTVSLIRKFIKEKPIDPSRIYVAGFSMGGTGSWDIITRHPELFTASLIASGETDTSKACLIKHIPVWAFCGEHDNIVPAKITKEMVEAVNYGGGNAKFTLLESMDHSIESHVFNMSGTKEWLFSQKKINQQ